MGEDQRISSHINELRKDIQELKEIVTPIADTYRTASTIGAWSKAFLVFISVTLGVIVGIRDLIRR